MDKEECKKIVMDKLKMKIQNEMGESFSEPFWNVVKMSAQNTLDILEEEGLFDN